MALGFFSGTLTPSQWHDEVALFYRRLYYRAHYVVLNIINN